VVADAYDVSLEDGGAPFSPWLQVSRWHTGEL